MSSPSRLRRRLREQLAGLCFIWLLCVTQQLPPCLAHSGKFPDTPRNNFRKKAFVTHRIRKTSVIVLCLVELRIFSSIPKCSKSVFYHVDSLRQDCRSNRRSSYFYLSTFQKLSFILYLFRIHLDFHLPTLFLRSPRLEHADQTRKSPYTQRPLRRWNLALQSEPPWLAPSSLVVVNDRHSRADVPFDQARPYRPSV